MPANGRWNLIRHLKLNLQQHQLKALQFEEDSRYCETPTKITLSDRPSIHLVCLHKPT